MSSYTEMDPAEILDLLEGIEDNSVEREKAAVSSFKDLSCPQCGGPVVPRVDPRNPFLGSGGLNYLAECSPCGALSSPKTGVIVKMGVTAESP